MNKGPLVLTPVGNTSLETPGENNLQNFLDLENSESNDVPIVTGKSISPSVFNDMAYKYFETSNGSTRLEFFHQQKSLRIAVNKLTPEAIALPISPIHSIHAHNPANLSPSNLLPRLSEELHAWALHSREYMLQLDSQIMSSQYPSPTRSPPSPSLSSLSSLSSVSSLSSPTSMFDSKSPPSHDKNSKNTQKGISKRRLREDFSTNDLHSSSPNQIIRSFQSQNLDSPNSRSFSPRR